MSNLRRESVIVVTTVDGDELVGVVFGFVQRLMEYVPLVRRRASILGYIKCL